MKLGYVLANLKLVERNRDWLRGEIPFGEKLRYYPAMARSMARAARGGPGIVNYLGAPFAFDNPATPLNLQAYPYEITHKVRSGIPNPTTVLDIGGNIGQFSRTAHFFWPDAEIDVFEPNPVPFGLLQKNTEHIPQISLFNFAIGSAGKQDFYYENGRSGTGSFLEDNVAALNSTESIVVDVTDDPARITGRSFYDLIKIDVEGYEMTVIENLAGIRCSCLYLEGSLGRQKNYSHDQLFAQIARTFGPYEITYLSEVVPTMGTFEATLRFEPNTVAEVATDLQNTPESTPISTQ
jgi:FkbM family methyltransferase